MRGTVDWIDKAIDNGVAALFGLACGYPALILFGATGGWTLAIAGSVAMLAFLAARRLLRRMGGSRRPAAEYALAPLPFAVELPTLELGPSERIFQPLSLAPVRAAVLGETRVVPLFGPTQQPSAGELAERIESHLACPQAPQSDQSDALFDALRQLRANLR